MNKREELIKKIEENDPEVLGKIADLILMQEGASRIKEIKCTTATLNKQIREKVKK